MHERTTARIVVYTEAVGAGGSTCDDIADAHGQIHSRVFVDGVELPYVNGITVDAKGGDFLTARLSVVPASVEFVPLTRDEFRLPVPPERT